MSRLPPDDPESWTDEEWLAWLEETDVEAAARARRPVQKADRYLRNAGHALRQLEALFHGRRPEEDVVIVADASGDPPAPDGEVDVSLDDEHPERSTAVVHRDRRRRA